MTSRWAYLQLDPIGLAGVDQCVYALGDPIPGKDHIGLNVVKDASCPEVIGFVNAGSLLDVCEAGRVVPKRTQRSL